MNLSELIAQVEENIGRDDKTSLIPSYINLALERIHNDYPRFPDWQRTSTSTLDEDARRIPLPDNFGAIFQLLFTNSETGPLRRITRREYDQEYPEVYTNGYKKDIPQVYCIWGDHLELYPVADQELTYILRWSRSPEHLTEDEDEPLLTGCDNTIIECATMIAYNRLGQPEEANQHYQIYQSHLNSAIQRVEDRNEDTEYKLKGYQAGRSTGSVRNEIRREDFI